MQYNLPSPVKADINIIKSLLKGMIQYCPKNTVKNTCSTLQVHLGIKSASNQEIYMHIVVFLNYRGGELNSFAQIFGNYQTKALN